MLAGFIDALQSGSIDQRFVETVVESVDKEHRIDARAHFFPDFFENCSAAKQLRSAVAGATVPVLQLSPRLPSQIVGYLRFSESQERSTII